MHMIPGYYGYVPKKKKEEESKLSYPTRYYVPGFYAPSQVEREEPKPGEPGYVPAKPEVVTKKGVSVIRG